MNLAHNVAIPIFFACMVTAGAIYQYGVEKKQDLRNVLMFAGAAGLMAWGNYNLAKTDANGWPLFPGFMLLMAAFKYRYGGPRANAR